VTREISRKIRSPAMRVAKQEKKEGHYGDVPVYRCVGDSGISVFHRPGRHYRPEASSLNRTKIAGKERARVLYFDRLDLGRTATQACGRSRLHIRTARLWTRRTAFQCDNAHHSALRRYRISVLSQRYRYCGHGSRLTPVGTRGAEV
jgi:hypothetical protein